MSLRIANFNLEEALRHTIHLLYLGHCKIRSKLVSYLRLRSVPYSRVAARPSGLRKVKVSSSSLFWMCKSGNGTKSPHYYYVTETVNGFVKYIATYGFANEVLVR